MLTDGIDGEGNVRRWVYMCNALCYLKIVVGKVYTALVVDDVNMAVFS